MHLVPRLVGILKIDAVDLQQRKIPFTFLGAADLPFHRVPGAQRKPPDLRGRDIDVVGPGQIVGVRRAQEAETVLQHFHDPFANDLDILIGEVF